jgi:hypothetical protein
MKSIDVPTTDRAVYIVSFIVCLFIGILWINAVDKGIDAQRWVGIVAMLFLALAIVTTGIWRLFLPTRPPKGLWVLAAPGLFAQAVIALVGGAFWWSELQAEGMSADMLINGLLVLVVLGSFGCSAYYLDISIDEECNKPPQVEWTWFSVALVAVVGTVKTYATAVASVTY